MAIRDFKYISITKSMRYCQELQNNILCQEQNIETIPNLNGKYYNYCDEYFSIQMRSQSKLEKQFVFIFQ